MRTFVTTDIHGELPRFQELLEKSGFDPEKDRMINLGDCVDRGPDSKGVVDELLKFKHLISIRGNHCDWFNTYIHTGLHPAPAYFNECRHSYTVDGGLEIPESHKEFFRNQLISYHDEHNRFFCHAGYDMTELVEHQEDEEFFWNRDLWKKAQSCKGTDRLKDINGFSQVFIGHSPTINSRIAGKPVTWPMYQAQVVNLDTGGCFGGKLSMIDITEPYAHLIYQS